MIGMGLPPAETGIGTTGLTVFQKTVGEKDQTGIIGGKTAILGMIGQRQDSGIMATGAIIRIGPLEIDARGTGIPATNVLRTVGAINLAPAKGVDAQSMSME